METLGRRLRKLRQSNKLSQEQVAQRLDVSKNAISQYERGLRQPSYDILRKMVSLYHTSADFLLGCSNARTVDVSGLTDAETCIITGLIHLMSEKNIKNGTTSAGKDIPGGVQLQEQEFRTPQS